MSAKILDNDSFIRKNFEKLVGKYPHQRIVVCQGKIFTGKDAVQKAKKSFPGAMPLSFPVPGPEEFIHIL